MPGHQLQQPLNSNTMYNYSPNLWNYQCARRARADSRSDFRDVFKRQIFKQNRAVFLSPKTLEFLASDCATFHLYIGIYSDNSTNTGRAPPQFRQLLIKLLLKEPFQIRRSAFIPAKSSTRPRCASEVSSTKKRASIIRRERSSV